MHEGNRTFGGVIEAEVQRRAVPQFDAFVEVPLDGAASFVEALDDGFLLMRFANDADIDRGVLQIRRDDHFVHREQPVLRTIVLLDDERELAAHEFTDFVEAERHGRGAGAEG